jgi:hypothetical protein
VTPSHGARSPRAAAAASEPPTHPPSRLARRTVRHLAFNGFPQQQWQWSCGAGCARAWSACAPGSGSPGRPPSFPVAFKLCQRKRPLPCGGESNSCFLRCCHCRSACVRRRDATRQGRRAAFAGDAVVSQLACSLAFLGLCPASALAAAALVRPSPCSGYVHVVPRPRLPGRFCFGSLTARLLSTGWSMQQCFYLGHRVNGSGGVMGRW